MEDKIRTLFKRGTPQCGLVYGVIAFVFGLLLVAIGFWKSLLIAFICFVAVFLGANKNYEQAVKNSINRVLPEDKVIKNKPGSAQPREDSLDSQEEHQKEHYEE